MHRNYPLRDNVARVDATIHLEQGNAGLVEAFGKAAANAQGSEALDAIAKAAIEGRIATLLIEADRLIPGRIDVAGNRITSCELDNPEVDDVLDDLDYRTGWIATVIKSGPLLGLFGTVLGMMAAFGRIGTGEKVQQSQIADEISIALVCTAMGLATAIPFNFFLASINNRVRKLQDSLAAGLARVLEHFKRNQS